MMFFYTCVGLLLVSTLFINVNYFLSIYLFKLCKHLYSYPEDEFLLIGNMLEFKNIVAGKEERTVYDTKFKA